jgi:hypothetical protein
MFFSSALCTDPTTRKCTRFPLVPPHIYDDDDDEMHHISKKMKISSNDGLNTLEYGPISSEVEYFSRCMQSTWKQMYEV